MIGQLAFDRTCGLSWLRSDFESSSLRLPSLACPQKPLNPNNPDNLPPLNHLPSDTGDTFLVVARMGLFSVFSSSSSSSTSAPPPVGGRARGAPTASSDPSSSKGARSASRSGHASELDADPFASSSALAGPSRGLSGTPRQSGEGDRTGATRRGEPPPYPGASKLINGSSKLAGARTSGDSDGGEFVGMGAFVSETGESSNIEC